MDAPDSSVNGSVLIVHQLHEGKHHYEVENVIKHRNAGGAKHTIRRGDKLVQINGTDLQDLTPEQLAEAIAEGQPMLTVHKPGKKKEHKEQLCSTEDTIRPVSKELTLLAFSMEMVREEDLRQNNSSLSGDEDELCPAEDEENKRESDLLVVTMTESSFSVLRGRGCDTGSSCRGCHGTGCTLSDIVMVAKSSTVTLVSRGGATFKQLRTFNTAVEHAATHKYLRSLCSQKTLYVSPHPGCHAKYSFIIRLVENDHLLLQVNLFGPELPGGFELHRLQLLSQVLQERRAGAPASGGSG
ncbi:interleukin-1 family member A isoform X2 [Festucalex cinctus]